MKGLFFLAAAALTPALISAAPQPLWNPRYDPLNLKDFDKGVKRLVADHGNPPTRVKNDAQQQQAVADDPPYEYLQKKRPQRLAFNGEDRFTKEEPKTLPIPYPVPHAMIPPTRHRLQARDVAGNSFTFPTNPRPLRLVDLKVGFKQLMADVRNGRTGFNPCMTCFTLHRWVRIESVP